MKIYYNNHPLDVKNYTTEDLRERFLIDLLFENGKIHLSYSHHDRIIVGGITPSNSPISLPVDKQLGTSYFLERREAGIINIGGKGKIIVDSEEIFMDSYDGIYLGCGNKRVTFVSLNSNHPAKFYMNSVPSTTPHPNKHIKFTDANPIPLGSKETLNERVIYQYVHPVVCQSTQLVMGMTLLKPGSVWNTMPCHTHERRMEVYLYFDMESSTRVFHMMGQPDETRHLILKNEQAVISPSWSIHTGVATSSYRFIWGMCGENQTFDDMDFIKIDAMK
jgi:4-deoxy-L-threo-5-hexosulose-uronate ketol-isomerase